MVKKRLTRTLFEILQQLGSYKNLFSVCKLELFTYQEILGAGDPDVRQLIVLFIVSLLPLIVKL